MICCKIPWNEIFYGDIIHKINTFIKKIKNQKTLRCYGDRRVKLADGSFTCVVGHGNV